MRVRWRVEIPVLSPSAPEVLWHEFVRDAETLLGLGTSLVLDSEVSGPSLSVVSAILFIPHRDGLDGEVTLRPPDVLLSAMGESLRRACLNNGFLPVSPEQSRMPSRVPLPRPQPPASVQARPMAPYGHNFIGPHGPTPIPPTANGKPTDPPRQ